ncbi:MAG: hypothetical protein CM1200mP9_10510 [Gammaproteobacteria bacterium]|nr:MAG: hypothetical protein CM1200mP9_10510 [Gammaproteobacteria bacterium]
MGFAGSVWLLKTFSVVRPVGSPLLVPRSRGSHAGRFLKDGFVKWNEIVAVNLATMRRICG